MSTATAYTATITPKAATGNGDLDDFAVTCTCGDSATWSLPTMAEQYAAAHEAWHARTPAAKARAAGAARPRARKAESQTRDVATLATKIRKGIRLYRRATVLPGGAWRSIGRQAEAVMSGSNAYEWPASVDTAVQGIAYALNTGRVGGSAAAAIRQLSDWDKCELVAEVALACDVIGKVPRYLIQRFTSQE